MTVLDDFTRMSARAPQMGFAQWVLRIPLAAILVNQGTMKLYGGIAANADAYAIPLWAFSMAALADFAAPTALLLGGLLRNWIGDALTRLGGLSIFASTVAVIAVIYAGAGWQGWQFQGLIAAGGLFFLLRGNDTKI